MISWIINRLKWVGLIAMLAPFALAYFEYDTASTANEFAKDGVEATAAIDGGTKSKRRRSGTSFSLDLSWKDKAGQPRQAEKVSIPRDIADKIIVNDQLTADTIQILYLPDDPARAPVIASTNARHIGDPVGGALKLFGMTLPIGLIGGGLFYFLHRREKRAAETTV